MPYTTIIKELQSNSILFYKRGLSELLINHRRGSFEPEIENIKVCIVLLQTAFEIILKAKYLNMDPDLILKEKNGVVPTASQVVDDFHSGSLNLKPFELIRQNERPNYNDYENNVIERFMQMRNKLIHTDFRIPNNKNSIEQLRIDIVAFAFGIIGKEYFEMFRSDYATFYKDILDPEMYEELCEIGDFIDKIRDLAKIENEQVGICYLCSQHTFGLDEGRCYMCHAVWDFSIKVLDCNLCDNHSVIYDALNIDINETIGGFCVICESKCAVFECKGCGRHFLVDYSGDNPKKCSPYSGCKYGVS